MRRRPTRETVAVDPFSPHAVRAAYDVAAEDYEAAFGDDLDHLPLDRAMLEAATDTVAGGGIALDLGCGTGVAGVRVAHCGVPTIGVDLSAGMLAVARARRQLPVAEADMRQLPFGAGAMALVVAFYSIQHVPRHELRDVLSEVARVLRPGGALLVAAHLGEGDVVTEEFLGHDIPPIGGALYSRSEITDEVVAAGFTLERAEERSHLAHEHPSQRIYLLARSA
jgi:ubiquinone/menaquinone biosynthesis C-methylase UbiE